jgi:hypothetical protein
MNNVLRNTLIVVAVLVLAGGIFLAGIMFASANGFGAGWMMGNNGNNGYGPGMTLAPSAHLPRTQVPGSAGVGRGGNGYGPGMMNGRGNNGYGSGMMGSGMMGGGGYGSNTNVAPLSVDQAKTAAESYLKTLGVDGLQVSEVMVFDNNAYVVVTETGTGNGAFELLVDSASRTAYPEFGPNMMWNLKYGGLNRSQMMGGRNGMTLAPGAHLPRTQVPGSAGVGGNGWDTTIPSDVSAEMSITPEKAIEYAQEYLDTNLKGAVAATDPIQFYGYYTLDFEKDGKVAGMLSVNGYNGQVFLHTWHGTFIEESAIQ